MTANGEIIKSEHPCEPQTQDNPVAYCGTTSVDDILDEQITILGDNPHLVKLQSYPEHGIIRKPPNIAGT